jgi:hypothetical protein
MDQTLSQRDALSTTLGATILTTPGTLTAISSTGEGLQVEIRSLPDQFYRRMRPNLSSTRHPAKPRGPHPCRAQASTSHPMSPHPCPCRAQASHPPHTFILRPYRAREFLPRPRPTYWPCPHQARVHHPRWDPFIETPRHRPPVLMTPT